MRLTRNLSWTKCVVNLAKQVTFFRINILQMKPKIIIFLKKNNEGIVCIFLMFIVKITSSEQLSQSTDPLGVIIKSHHTLDCRLANFKYWTSFMGVHICEMCGRQRETESMIQ